jgi:hypothetical protein
MQKYHVLSAGLSLLVITLLPVHHYLTLQLAGKTDWLNMAFGLPIGLATALNFDIVIRKINRKK